MTEKYHTVKEVAKLLRVPIQRIYEAISAGELKAYKLSERNTRIADSELQKYLEEKATPE